MGKGERGRKGKQHNMIQGKEREVGRVDRIRSEGKVSKPSFLLEAKVGKREREREEEGGRLREETIPTTTQTVIHLMYSLRVNSGKQEFVGL